MTPGAERLCRLLHRRAELRTLRQLEVELDEAERRHEEALDRAIIGIAGRPTTSHSTQEVTVV